MKSFIAFTLFVAVASALPVSNSKDATVLKFSLNNIGIGSYNFAYETSDGKAASEVAELKNVGTENEGIEVRGFFLYPGDDKKIYRVDYIANDKGFQPSAPHLPVA